MLTAKEKKQLADLIGKEKAQHQLLTVDDYTAINSRLDYVYEKSPEWFARCAKVLREFTEALKPLADDNARLILEIEYLKEEINRMKRDDAQKEKDE